WKIGVAQTWVPGAVRNDFQWAAQEETSSFNRFLGNHMGTDIAGHSEPNGLDFYWDGQGMGNCWQSDHPSGADPLTTPRCPGGASSFLLSGRTGQSSSRDRVACGGPARAVAPAGRPERRARRRRPARGGRQRGRHAPGAGRSSLDTRAARADVDGLDGRRIARRNSTLPAAAGHESSRQIETRTRPCEPETTNTTCAFPVAVTHDPAQ